MILYNLLCISAVCRRTTCYKFSSAAVVPVCQSFKKMFQPETLPVRDITTVRYESMYQNANHYYTLNQIYIHGSTGPISFRGAGVSCPNIFSIACPKIKWFCPNITRFIFWPEYGYLKNSGGGGGAAARQPPPPPPSSPPRTPMSISSNLRKTI